MKKKEKAINFLNDNILLFRCPVCKNNFQKVEGNQLQCIHNHSFDVSKKGTIHFLLKQVKSGYTREVLEARSVVAKKGFWKPLLKNIITSVKDLNGNHLDVGCGEGSHFHSLSELGLSGNKVGFDLSKDAVQLAAAQYEDAFWCVADLADSPFASGTYDTIFNILSPSNYNEFDRLLKEGGQVIKVIPNEGYLKELRDEFYQNEKPYSNRNVIDLFHQHYSTVTQNEIKYSIGLNREEMDKLIEMTPLAWQVGERKRKGLLDKNISSVTVDLMILIGTK